MELFCFMRVSTPSPIEQELCLERLFDVVSRASYDSRAWSGLVQALADELTPGGCEIAFHPRHGRSPQIRLNVLSAVSGSSPTSQSSRNARRPASLTLGEAPNGVWRIELWSNAEAEGGGRDRAKALLALLGASLCQAFQLSLALRAGMQPAKAMLCDLWDPLPFGVMLVEPSLRLLFANTAAEDFLHTAALFRPAGIEGFVRPARRENFAALTQACEMVLDGAGDRASFPMLDYRERGFGDVTVFAPPSGLFGWSGPRVQDVAPSRLVVTLSPFEACPARADEDEASVTGGASSASKDAMSASSTGA